MEQRLPGINPTWEMMVVVGVREFLSSETELKGFSSWVFREGTNFNGHQVGLSG
jgi:hypothetical protein